MCDGKRSSDALVELMGAEAADDIALLLRTIADKYSTLSETNASGRTSREELAISFALGQRLEKFREIMIPSAIYGP